MPQVEVSDHTAARMKEVRRENKRNKVREFIVIATYEFDMGGETVPVAELGCPRKDCRRVFIVDKAAFKSSHHTDGRPCPYCFRWAWIPGRKP